MSGDRILAVDLGGTKVAAAVIGIDGAIDRCVQEPTSQEGPAAGISQISRLLRDLIEQCNLEHATIRGIGVGIPAVLDEQDDRVIWAPNLKGWRNVALRPALEQEFGLPACVEYDGHTAVLGEWWQGAGRGYRSIAMVIAGTGIGGGLILDGKLFRGHNRLAGAAGWFALTTDASLESEDGRAIGHWEALAAGPGIAARAIERLPGYPGSSLAHMQAITAREIFEQARVGDAFARECVLEEAALLGIGVANIVSLVNPEIVILGGSVGRQGDLLVEPVREVVMRWAQPISARSVAITASTLGANAGLYGAAYALQTRLDVK